MQFVNHGVQLLILCVAIQCLIENHPLEDELRHVKLLTGGWRLASDDQFSSYSAADGATFLRDLVCTQGAKPTQVVATLKHAEELTRLCTDQARENAIIVVSYHSIVGL